MTCYEKGEQPCSNLKRKFDGNSYATWENVHECYRCLGKVSFCENCAKDHHEDGYETCTPEARLKTEKQLLERPR